MRTVLLLDCQDSFAYLLADCLRRLEGIHTMVVPENQAPDALPDGIDALLLSPGPGLPAEHPAAFRLLASCPEQVTVLGICLGYQILGLMHGMRLVHLDRPRHGRQMNIRFSPCRLTGEKAWETKAGLYHSWALSPEAASPEVQLCAVDEEGVPMALQHRSLPRYGLQFHPESVLTPCGAEILSRIFCEQPGETGVTDPVSLQGRASG